MNNQRDDYETVEQAYEQFEERLVQIVREINYEDLLAAIEIEAPPTPKIR